MRNFNAVSWKNAGTGLCLIGLVGIGGCATSSEKSENQSTQSSAASVAEAPAEECHGLIRKIEPGADLEYKVTETTEDCVPLYSPDFEQIGIVATGNTFVVECDPHLGTGDIKPRIVRVTLAESERTGFIGVENDMYQQMLGNGLQPCTPPSMPTT